MGERTFRLEDHQWERFVETIESALGELLTAGMLNDAADEVIFLGGRASVDLRGTVDSRSFTVEVKTAWWHGKDREVIAHSPLRASQEPDLVALFGTFDPSGATRTVRRIEADALVVNDDRFFYLVPVGVIREHSRAHGKSTARALIETAQVEPFAVDLARGLTYEALIALLDRA